MSTNYAKRNKKDKRGIILFKLGVWELKLFKKNGMDEISIDMSEVKYVQNFSRNI
jgi:hypothetical protein